MVLTKTVLEKFALTLTLQALDQLEVTLLKQELHKKPLEFTYKPQEMPIHSLWPLTTVQTQKDTEEKWPYSTSIAPQPMLQESPFTHITEKTHQLHGRNTRLEPLSLISSSLQLTMLDQVKHSPMFNAVD